MIKRREFLALTAAATLAPMSMSRASTGSHSLDAVLSECAIGALEQLGVVQGLAVGVFHQEGVIARGFGVTDVNTQERVTEDTLFYIASSTKPLTALALTALAGRGELDLEANLATFSPEAPFPAFVRESQVRLRHLLTHTSGVVNDGVAWRLAWSGQHDPDTLWRLLASCTVNEAASLGRFGYANAGYNIATLLTDRYLATPWQELLRREVFTPLGMATATARASETGRLSRARPHDAASPAGAAPLYLDKTDATMHSAGGVLMSANDAVLWLEAMIRDGVVGGRRVLPAAIVEQTREPCAVVHGASEGYRREHYGLGWFIGRHRDDLLVHHFGRFPGFRSHISYKPAQGVGVAAFVNDSRVGDSIVDALADLVYDVTARRRDAARVFHARINRAVRRRDQLWRAVSQDRARRSRREWTLSRPFAAYAGEYVSQEFGAITVSADNGLNVEMGVLRARAEPFTQPDSIRVELTPSVGVPLLFSGQGARPEGLMYQGMRFERA